LIDVKVALKVVKTKDGNVASTVEYRVFTEHPDGTWVYSSEIFDSREDAETYIRRSCGSPGEYMIFSRTVSDWSPE
jgi:hypothetical protein